MARTRSKTGGAEEIAKILSSLFASQISEEIELPRKSIVNALLANKYSVIASLILHSNSIYDEAKERNLCSDSGIAI